MPDAALPIRRPAPPVVPAGALAYRRVFVDLLGRPLAGWVTITGVRAITAGHVTAMPTPVQVKLTPAGLLEVPLLPDTYQIAAELRTVDGTTATYAGQFTIT